MYEPYLTDYKLYVFCLLIIGHSAKGSLFYDLLSFLKSVFLVIHRSPGEASTKKEGYRPCLTRPAYDLSSWLILEAQVSVFLEVEALEDPEGQNFRILTLLSQEICGSS